MFHELHFPFSPDFSLLVSPECLLPNTPQSSSLDPNIDLPEAADVLSHPELVADVLSQVQSPVPSPTHPVHPSTSSLHDSVPEVPTPISFNPDIIPTTIPAHSPDSSSSSLPLRKSSRVHSHPSYLKDYVYTLPSFLSCSVTQHKEFEPYTYSRLLPYQLGKMP